MDSAEDEARKAEQSRALDIHRPSGATIRHSYLERQQEAVSVTKDDLEDILGFDGVAAAFGGFGIFLLSGSVWLIAENLLSSEGFVFNNLMAFCIACLIFGGASLLAGWFFHSKKRGRIQRIFNQTKPISASNPSTRG